MARRSTRANVVVWSKPSGLRDVVSDLRDVDDRSVAATRRRHWRRAQQHALRARFLVRRCALWAVLARQRRRRREQARALAELAAVDSKSIRFVSQDHHAPTVEPRLLCLRAQACLGFELYRACLWLVGAGLWRALDIEGERHLCPCVCVRHLCRSGRHAPCYAVAGPRAVVRADA